MEFKQELPVKRCKVCRKPIVVNRNRPDEFIVWQDQYFHIDCYKAYNIFSPKCAFCGEQMDISIGNPEQAICYKNKYYHNDCFKAWSTATKTPSKIRLADYANREEYIRACTDVVSKKLGVKIPYEQVISESHKTVQRKFAESDVNTFIKSFYDITTIGGTIWTKLETVYNGTYKNLEEPIPPEDLLDMWQGKKNFLRKTNANYESKHGKFTSIQGMIFYDLAILVSKYEDYKKWKRKKEIEARQAVITSEQRPLVDLVMPKAKQETKSNYDDIVDVVDDIFGD